MAINMNNIQQSDLADAACNNDVDAALGPLQAMAGIETGDVAAQVFSGFCWTTATYHERLAQLMMWVSVERAYARDDEEGKDEVAPAMQPCKFTFDDTPEFDGFAYGTTWNGFDNVAVTPQVRDQIVAYFKSIYQGRDWDEAYSDFERAVVETDGQDKGLVSFAFGYTTQIVR